MLVNINKLHGYTIQATDGDIGTVRTWYFDDLSWVIRYLVVDTGTWLPGKRVLIAPEAVGQPDIMAETLVVKLTREQVENSPDIDTDKPVSRQQQIALHAYYAWSEYWAGDALVAEAAMARPGIPLPPPPSVSPEPVEIERGDPHLQSMREVIGYYIEASDGSIGHVEDFIVDTTSWHIRYMVVDTRNWLPGKKVLVAPTWISRINWADAQVHVDLTQDSIKQSPQWDPQSPIQRQYEEQLFKHYDRPRYW
jgi:hypothetical protein